MDVLLVTLQFFQHVDYVHRTYNAVVILWLKGRTGVVRVLPDSFTVWFVLKLLLWQLATSIWNMLRLRQKGIIEGPFKQPFFFYNSLGITLQLL